MFKSYSNIVSEIFSAFVAAIRVFFPTYDPDFGKKTPERGFAEGHGKELWNASLLNEKIRRQNNPLQADSDSDQSYGTLEQWGIAKIGRRPFIEGRGEYSVLFIGTGGIYEAGYNFVNSNTGFIYTLKDRVVVNEGSEGERITFTSELNFGGDQSRFSTSYETGEAYGVVVSALGGLPAALKPGNQISSTQILAGIDNPALITEVLVEPTEAESITEYRGDVLQAYRLPPRGGDRGDYVLWGEEVPGVRRISPYAGDNTGLLGAAWLIIESTIGDGSASDELIDAVRRKIDSKIAISDPGIVFESVTVTKRAVIIEGFFGVEEDDINDAKNSILTTVENYFKSIRAFVDGVDRSTSKNDTLKRVELVAVALDAAAIYGGVISDAYWNIDEREREVAQNEIFRLSFIAYI